MRVGYGPGKDTLGLGTITHPDALNMCEKPGAVARERMCNPNTPTAK